ncbi:MAG TPA: energy-coupling factor transporter transmembrane component T [Candidatus Dormibacteraeota bacterium]|jgi:energy-coupling factor transport system permease protein
MKFHPLTWCIWSVSALAAAFLDRNPFLQVALLMVLINAWLPYRERHAVPHWKLAIVLATVPVVFSVALSRFGHHLLFSLPSIPIIGGAWTLEALVFGASTGMALLLVIGAFAILQSTVRSADLVALLPRPLYRGGTVFALAITFAPQTMTSLNSIMEARRIRHQRTGWRAAPQLLLPLLLTTLERALQYAESLDARGYGSRRRSQYRHPVFRLRDAVVVAAALLSLAWMIVAPAAPFNAYQDLVPALPGVAGLGGILLLAAPAALSTTHRGDDVAHRV